MVSRYVNVHIIRALDCNNIYLGYFFVGDLHTKSYVDVVQDFFPQNYLLTHKLLLDT